MVISVAGSLLWGTKSLASMHPPAAFTLRDLEAARSLLKPQGHILIGTPYHGYLKNLVLAATGKMDGHFSALHDGGHIKFFSVKTLSTLMRAHGFEDLSFTFYGRAPWLWKNMICHARKT